MSSASASRRLVLAASIALAASNALAPAPADAAPREQPRYHRGPLADAQWQGMIGAEVLLVLSTGYRVCGEITSVEQDVIHYVDPDIGDRRVARSMVMSVHERSWECDRDSSVPKVEWARPGAAVGMSLAGLGLVFGVLQDAGVFGRPASYAVLGAPTLAFASPIAGFAGRSTARDLRVRGLPWARVSGWVAYGGALACFGLWVAGQFGEVDALAGPGLATAAGGLGAVGAGLLGADALRSRRELHEFRRLDSQPVSASRGSLRVGLVPLGGAGRLGGLGVGVGGRF